VSGSLGGTDCQFSTEGCTLFCTAYYHDRFAFVMPAAGAIQLDIASSETGAVTAYLLDATSSVVAFAQAATFSSWDVFWAILPPGNYELEIREMFGESTYTFSTRVSGSDLGCNIPFVARGVTTTQSLSSIDCVRDDNGSRYIDRFMIQLSAHQTATVAMSSTQFDTRLEVERLEGYPGGGEATRIASNEGQGVPAQIVQTCESELPCLFRIVATSRLASGSGSYVLTVQ
jgi:hypothetical protein